MHEALETLLSLEKQTRLVSYKFYNLSQLPLLTFFISKIIMDILQGCGSCVNQSSTRDDNKYMF